jgi:hypothetical protein
MLEAGLSSLCTCHHRRGMMVCLRARVSALPAERCRVPSYVEPPPVCADQRVFEFANFDSAQWKTYGAMCAQRQGGLEELRAVASPLVLQLLVQDGLMKRAAMRKIQRNACRVLGHSSFTLERQQRGDASASIREAAVVVAALEEHPQSKASCEACSQALSALVAVEDGADAVAEADGIDTLLRVMELHSEVENVQRHGWRALGLMAKWGWSVKVIMDRGLAKLLAVSLGEHHRSAKVLPSSMPPMCRRRC